MTRNSTRALCFISCVIVFCAALMIVASIDTAAYADSSDEDSITVYLTINDENGFVVGNDDAKTVMCRVPIKLSYVDLADYGLEKYYRYETESYVQDGVKKIRYKKDGDIVKQPTVLMLYLKALSKYYLNREITKADINDNELKALCLADQAPTSLFMTHFWGHHMNLLYYVNHEYPLMYEGWGATADYIVLEEGDSVEVQLMPDMEINAFRKFDIDEEWVEQDEELEFTLYRLGQNLQTGSGTVARPLASFPIIYSKDYGKTWKRTGIKSGDDGSFTFPFNETGVYYITTGALSGSSEYHYGMPTAVVHVAPKRVTGGKGYTGSGSIKYCFDDVDGKDGYNIYYRKKGDDDWLEGTALNNVFELKDPTPGTVYEFKAQAYVTDKYVVQGEPYQMLKGEESEVTSYTATQDEAVIGAANALEEIPAVSDLTLSDKDKIDNARTLYDALSDEQKVHITPADISKLEAAEERLAELQAEKDARDKQEATAVTNMITALPSVATVTFDDKDEVNAAYDAYQALSQEGKALIKSISLNKLTQLKAKIDAWQDEEDTANANHVRELINDLPPLSTVKLSDKAKVYAAYDEYQALTDGVKAKIGDYYTSKLSDLKEKVDKLQKEADEKAAREKAAKEALAKKKAAAKKYTVTGLKVKAKSRKFTVSWNKTKGATGYQVQYKLKAAKKWSALKTTKSLKAVSKKLKKGKKYSFRVRTYTVLSGSKVCGKWSGVKTAKCK